MTADRLPHEETRERATNASASGSVIPTAAEYGPPVAKTRAQQVADFQLALEMFDVGVELMRQNLRRKFPRASPRLIDAKLQAWLLHRPGAEHGDAAGRPSKRLVRSS